MEANCFSRSFITRLLGFFCATKRNHDKDVKSNEDEKKNHYISIFVHRMREVQDCSREEKTYATRVEKIEPERGKRC